MSAFNTACFWVAVIAFFVAIGLGLAWLTKEAIASFGFWGLTMVAVTVCAVAASLWMLTEGLD